MGIHTGIGWTDHTFNIVWGCTKVSEGCFYCYAEKWAERLGRDLWGPNAERRIFGEAHWREPLAWNAAAVREGVRRRVFCSSMADVFEDHPALVAERAKLWSLIEATPQLDWQLLTKRPENVERMVPDSWKQSFHVDADVPPAPGWPRNAWLGFTAENNRRLLERWAIIEWLGRRFRIPVLYCSGEPMLEELDVEIMLDDECDGHYVRPLDWLIVGGESGPKARRFELDWIGGMLRKLDGLDLPVFVKQMGSRPTVQGQPLKLKHHKGEDPAEWPCLYRRQEFPTPSVNL